MMMRTTLLKCIAILSCASTSFAQEPAGQADRSLAEATLAVGSGLGLAMTHIKANAGNAEAQYLLATSYRLGSVLKEDTGQALKWLQRAADQHYGPALAELGYHYKFGTLGVDKNDAMAVSYFEQAVSEGNSYAQAMLGRSYLYGEMGLPKEPYQALPLLRLAADKNEVTALIELGWMYETGSLLEKDIIKAESLYHRAARRGNASGQHYLATLYWQQQEILNQEKAIYWYEHAVAQNFPRSFYNLGEIYRRGDKKHRNLTKALGLYMRGADLEEPHCLTMLGYLYSNGIIVTQNKQKALDFLRRAADIGHAEAHTRIAAFYLDDLDDSWSNDTGLPWLFKAVSLDDNNAKDLLTHLYLQRPDFIAALPDAIKQLEQYADTGNAHAQTVLGYYFFNEPVQDFATSRYWFEKAARVQNADAQYLLFFMHYRGQGTDQNLDRAKEWLLKAAENGSAHALYGVARAYHYGNSELAINKDVDKALSYFSRAHDQGHKRAANDLAWFLSTSPNQGVRDGERALRIIEGALSSNPRSEGWVDTLAAAYAELGDFDQAINFQLEAIRLAESTGADTQAPPDFYQRLAYYQDKKPWRDATLADTQSNLGGDRR